MLVVVGMWIATGAIATISYPSSDGGRLPYTSGGVIKTFPANGKALVDTSIEVPISAQIHGPIQSPLPDRLPPPPSTVSVIVDVYNGIGTVIIGQAAYSNGQVATLEQGYAYALSVGTISQPFQYMTVHFTQWMSTAGSVTNTADSSTTFVPETNGAVVMVLMSEPNIPNLYVNWGGYIASGSNIEKASGQFNIAYNLQYYYGVTGAPSSNEYLSEWVGLGGTSSSSNLWQAGIVIKVTSSEVSYYAFAAAVTSNSYTEFDSSSIFNQYLYSGENISVNVWYEPTTGTCYWTVHGLNTISGYYVPPADAWFNGSCTFAPGTSSAEWIGEDPVASGTNNGYVEPVYTYPIVFSGMSLNSNTNSLVAPVMGQYEQDAWNLLLGGYVVQQLIPSSISNENSFTLAYQDYTG